MARLASCLYLLLLAMWLGGCAKPIEQAPDIIDERIIQASRKGEIVVDGLPSIIVIGSNLNQIDRYTYSHREYFLLEIYSANPSYYPLMHFKLNGKSPIWSRKIEKNELDSIIKSDNHWAVNYLVAFKKINVIVERNSVLHIDTPLGGMDLDFTFHELESQF